MKKLSYCIIVFCFIFNLLTVSTVFGTDDSFVGIYHMKDDPNQTLEILKTGIDEYKLVPGNNEWYCIGFLSGKYFKGSYRYVKKYDNVTGFTQIELIGNGVIQSTSQISLHPKESKSEIMYIKKAK